MALRNKGSRKEVLFTIPINRRHLMQGESDGDIIEQTRETVC